MCKALIKVQFDSNIKWNANNLSWCSFGKQCVLAEKYIVCLVIYLDYKRLILRNAWIKVVDLAEYVNKNDVWYSL